MYWSARAARASVPQRGHEREVIADSHARYFDAELSERTLLPGDDARIASRLPRRQAAPSAKRTKH